MKVLLAEDDPNIRRVAQVALARAGFVVSVVGDGIEALQLLEDELPDLIVLDGMMPKMDGLDACRRIKANPRTANIPVIILSARSQNADEHAARDVGAIAYIKKPFNALTLGAEVRALLATQEVA
jgi:two-component system phosphate regulon response regulator PhoB